MKRRPRDMIDTAWKQGRNVGFLSFAKPASYVPDIAAGVAQFCLERSAVIDGILFTGDLATTGLMADIGVAYSFIAEPAKNGFVTETGSPTVNVSSAPIHVLPGNHDKFVNVTGAPNCRTFELKFEAYMRNFSSGVGHWVRRKQGQFIGFLCADFCLQSRQDALDKVVGPYGQGRVYQDVLEELKSRTFRLRKSYKEIQIVWLIHFAPFDCGYSLQLIDWDRIIDAARALRVLATLCGHTHQASKFVVDSHTILQWICWVC